MAEAFEIFMKTHQSLIDYEQAKQQQLMQMSQPILEFFNKLSDPNSVSLGHHQLTFEHKVSLKRVIFEFGLLNNYNPCAGRLGYGNITIAPYLREPYTLFMEKWGRAKIYATCDQMMSVLATEYAKIIKECCLATEISVADMPPSVIPIHRSGKK